MLLNFNATPHPPRLALPVGVGIGKTTAMQRAVAGLLRSEALSGRKIVIGVPRHDLAEEQRAAFWSLDVDAMVWKGRSAPDPSPDNPDRLMCLDPSAPFDAMEVERIVETTSCKVTQRGTTHICPFYKSCGYQAQKRQLEPTALPWDRTGLTTGQTRWYWLRSVSAEGNVSAFAGPVTATAL